MKTRKSLTMTGVAVAIAAASGPLAIAGIDAGGSPIKTGGSITQFGSIYVNGTRYDTSNAVFIIDGRIGDESELNIGQVVSLYGAVGSDGGDGVAWVVSYDDLLEGAITKIDEEEGFITVLGQRVEIDADTIFALSSGTASIEGLEEGDFVEISGFRGAIGRIVASYVGDGDGSGIVDLTGTVTHSDAGSASFSVNGLEVDYSEGQVHDFDGGAPQIGDAVEIFGEIDADTGRFVASQVWPALSAAAAGPGTYAEVEGYISEQDSFTRFEIDGVPVRITWSTSFENDWFFALETNRKVEVSGRYDESGWLVAEHVEFEEGAKLKLSGTVEGIDAESVFVNGLRIRITNETAYKDESELDQRYFGFGDVHVGDVIEVRGYDVGGSLVATMLERKDSVETDEEDD